MVTGFLAVSSLGLVTSAGGGGLYPGPYLDMAQDDCGRSGEWPQRQPSGSHTKHLPHGAHLRVSEAHTLEHAQWQPRGAENAVKKRCCRLKMLFECFLYNYFLLIHNKKKTTR